MNHIKVENYWDKVSTNFTGSVIDNIGTITYYLNGKVHRVDGPAIEQADGDKFWFLHDKRHRVDGPAVEWSDGDKYWYYDDEFISKDPNYTLEEFQREIKLKLFK